MQVYALLCHILMLQDSCHLYNVDIFYIFYKILCQYIILKCLKNVTLRSGALGYSFPHLNQKSRGDYHSGGLLSKRDMSDVFRCSNMGGKTNNKKLSMALGSLQITRKHKRDKEQV